MKPIYKKEGWLAARFFILGQIFMKNKQYRKPRSGEIIQLSRYFKDINNVANYLQKEFINNTIFVQTKTEQLGLNINKSNYMHLCGILYQRGAKNFFEDALSNKLDLASILIKKDGSTFSKLSMLGLITKLFDEKLELTHSGKYLYLQFDHSIRTSSQRFAIALRDRGTISYPISFLNLRYEQRFPRGQKIENIYAVNKQTHRIKNLKNTNNKKV